VVASSSDEDNSDQEVRFKVVEKRTKRTRASQC